MKLLDLFYNSSLVQFMSDVIHFIGHNLQEVSLRILIQNLEVILLLQINLLNIHAIIEKFIYYQRL